MADDELEIQDCIVLSPNGEAIDPAPRPQSETQSSVVPGYRSCLTCRRRKVRCDKKLPCSNCLKAKIPCSYPSPKRISRQQPSNNQEWAERVNMLENIVKMMSQQLNKAGNRQISHHDSQLHPSNAREEHDGAAKVTSEPIPENAEPAEGPQLSAQTQMSPDGINCASTGRKLSYSDGKWVREDGQYHYINNSFWAVVHELNECRGEDAEDWRPEADAASPCTEASVASGASGFLFQPATPSEILPRPASSLVGKLWYIFKQRCDPVIKVLHIPSVERLMMAPMNNTERPTKNFSALLFSICFTAVTSINDEVCIDELQEDRQTLLARFRQGFDTSFMSARLTDSTDLQLLQALVIFLTGLRRHDARAAWLLSGLAERLCRLSAVHRDGTYLKLSPFETELRRRIWWNLLALDGPSSEDIACDPTILETGSDAIYPRNVNDADLEPDMTEEPADIVGFTESTFTLARAEVVQMWRIMLNPRIQVATFGKPFFELTVEEKEDWVREREKHFEYKYLRHCRSSVPIQWVTFQFIRIIFSKIRLCIYTPLEAEPTMNETQLNLLFSRCIDSVEYSYQLRTDGRTWAWKWFFNSHVQWHSLAFVLQQLSLRPFGHDVDRAWKAVEQTLVLRWDTPPDHMRAQNQWQLMLRMVDKARSARKEGARQRRVATRDQHNIPAIETDDERPTGLSAASNGMRSAQNTRPTSHSIVGKPDDAEVSLRAPPKTAPANASATNPQNLRNNSSALGSIDHGRTTAPIAASSGNSEPGPHGMNRSRGLNHISASLQMVNSRMFPTSSNTNALSDFQDETHPRLLPFPMAMNGYPHWGTLGIHDDLPFSEMQIDMLGLPDILNSECDAYLTDLQSNSLL